MVEFCSTYCPYWSVSKWVNLPSRDFCSYIYMWPIKWSKLQTTLLFCWANGNGCPWSLINERTYLDCDRSNAYAMQRMSASHRLRWMWGVFSRVMLYLSSGWGLLMSLRTCYIQSFKKTSWDLGFFDHSLPADDPFDFDVNLIQDDFKQSYYSVILLMIGLPRYMWDMPSP